MKKFTKDYTLSIRLSGKLISRIDNLIDEMGLDRADLIRMILNNGVRYWENSLNQNSSKSTNPQIVEKRGKFVEMSKEEEEELERRFRLLK